MAGRQFSFDAYGTPAPQGSKKSFVVAGHVNTVDDSKATAPWRNTVTIAAIEAKRADPEFEVFTGGVFLEIIFWMPRPKGAPKTIDVIPITKPDNDKVQRSTYDAITAAGLWKDDNLVAAVHSVKRYAVTRDFAFYDPDEHREEPGAQITITDMGRAWGDLS